MIRIIFFIDRYYPTDHAFIEEVYSKILPRKGYDVTIVARSKTQTRIEFKQWNDSKLILMPSKKKYLSDFKTLRKAHALMRANYQIVQVRNDPLFALIAPSDKFVFQLSHLKAEQFLTEKKRSLFSIVKGGVDLLLRCIYMPRAKFIFPISDEMKKFLKDRYGVENSMAVPLGVSDIKIDKPTITRIKNKYNLKNKTSFIYIGTLAKSRRLDVVLDAYYAAYHKSGGRLSILFLGDAPNKKDVVYLKRRAEERSLPGVYFIDRVPRAHVPNYIAACDVGLSTTPINQVNNCMSPTKSLEYLNAGTPVLATRIPDQEHIITESNSGIFCDFEPHDIAEKMIEFHHCEDRTSMGHRGREYVRKKRNYESIAEIVVSAYRQLNL